MDKELLIRVLGTNNRVVIPTFGAFLRKQQGEALVFSPFLKSDDGFLAGIVREEYDISEDDARQMVASFAEHIASVLRARTKYYVDGVGTLVLDDNGAVSFVMDTTRQIPPSQYSAPSAEAAPSQPIQQQQQAPPVPQPQQPVNPRPVVAPQPISATRPTYAPQQAAIPVPAPAPTPVRPVSAVRPVAHGGFARPTQNSAPIAQPQPAAPIPASAPQPMAQQPQQPQQNQSQSPNAQPSGAPQSGGPMNRSAVGAGSNMQQRRRPAARKKAKNDVWLIVAIVAALVVVVLMVIGILTANEMSSIQI